MKYIVDRKYQGRFCDALSELGFDGYGDHPDSDEDGYYENDVFIVRPFYWGDDEGRYELPNFEFKPTGFKLEWYKYPLRSAKMNQDIDFKQVINWLENECYKSVYGDEKKKKKCPNCGEELWTTTESISLNRLDPNDGSYQVVATIDWCADGDAFDGGCGYKNMRFED